MPPPLAAGIAIMPVITAALSVITTVLTSVFSVVAHTVTNLLQTLFFTTFQVLYDAIKGLTKTIFSVLGGLISLTDSKGSKGGGGGLDQSWIGRRLTGAFTLDSDAFQRIRKSMLAVAGAIGILGFNIDESKERIKVLLLTTRSAAGYTYDEIIRVTNAIAGMAHATKIQGREAAAIFLAQGRIRGPLFGEAMQVLPDLAAALGMKLPQAAAKFADALARPERGLALIEEMGVVLPAVFVEQFTAMATSSMAGFLRAQQFILESVRNTARGANDVFRNTLSGFYMNIKEHIANLPQYFEPFIKPFAKLFSGVMDGISDVLERNRDFFVDMGHRLQQFVDWAMGMIQPVKNMFADIWPQLRPVVTGLMIILPAFSMISHFSKLLLANFGLLVGVIAAVSFGATALIRVLGVVLLLFEGVRRAFTVGEVRDWLARLVSGVELFLGAIASRMGDLFVLFQRHADDLGVKFRALIRILTQWSGSVENVMTFLGHFMVDSTEKLISLASRFFGILMQIGQYVGTFVAVAVSAMLGLMTGAEGSMVIIREMALTIKGLFVTLFDNVLNHWKPVFAEFVDWFLQYWEKNLQPFLSTLGNFLIGVMQFILQGIKYFVAVAITSLIKESSDFFKTLGMAIAILAGSLFVSLLKSVGALFAALILTFILGFERIQLKFIQMFKRVPLFGFDDADVARAEESIAESRRAIPAVLSGAVPDFSGVRTAWDGITRLFEPEPPKIGDIPLPRMGLLVPDDRLVDRFVAMGGPFLRAIGLTHDEIVAHARRVTEGPLVGLIRMMTDLLPARDRARVDLGIAPAPRPAPEAPATPAPLPNIIPAKISFMGLQELYKNIQTQSFQGRMVTLTERIVNQGAMVVARLDDVNAGIRDIVLPADRGPAVFG